MGELDKVSFGILNTIVVHSNQNLYISAPQICIFLLPKITRNGDLKAQNKNKIDRHVGNCLLQILRILVSAHLKVTGKSDCRERLFLIKPNPTSIFLAHCIENGWKMMVDVVAN